MNRTKIEQQINELITLVDNATLLEVQTELNKWKTDDQSLNEDVMKGMSDTILLAFKTWIARQHYDLMARQLERIRLAGTYNADLLDWLLVGNEAVRDLVVLLGQEHHKLKTKMQEFWNQYIYQGDNQEPVATL